MSGCRDFSEYFLMFINGFLLFLSVLILGFGAYIFANVGTDLSQISLSTPAAATVTFGALLLLFSLIGILATYLDMKVLMAIYIVGTMLVTFGVMAAGAALLTYTRFLQDIKATSLQFTLEEDILSYELAVYNDCCAFEGSGLAPPESCADNGNFFPCYADAAVFAEFTSFIGNTTCSVFAQFGIVGDPADGGCGGGSAQTFVENISTFIEANLNRLGLIDIILSVFMLVMIVTACYLLWTKDDDEKKGNARKEIAEDEEDGFGQ